MIEKEANEVEAENKTKESHKQKKLVMTSDGLDEEGKYRVRFEDELYKFEKNDTKVSFD